MHDLQANRRDTGTGKADHVRGGTGEIDHAIVHKGAPIVDAYYHAPLCIEILHPHDRAEGERPVGRRELVGVKNLTVRREAALELAAVPGGVALEGVAGESRFIGYEYGVTQNVYKKHRNDRGAQEKDPVHTLTIGKHLLSIYLTTGIVPARMTHWADINAAKVVREKGEKPVYTCASGITPSGTVHVGNFREIISVDLVVRALRDAGHRVRFIYSWDDYDVFRKVPKNVPNPAEYEQYLRRPITLVPDPGGEYESYARANEADLERELHRVGIDPEYIYQAERYRASAYAEGIRVALEKRETIREILNRFRTSPLPAEWWPVSVFSRFTDSDNTTVLGWDGEWGVRYRCEDTGTEDTVDLRSEGYAKLPWRIDWPMRWKAESVDFEPAGKDHHSEGGSFDTARHVVSEVYGGEAPVTFQYDFISIKGRGGKMSSSSGEVISLRDVLEVYQPEIVRYLFAGTRPNTEFAISFDLDVIKIYEDYDRCERIYFGQEEVAEKRADKERRIYELSQVHQPPTALPAQIPFRHLCNMLLINDGDIKPALESMPGYAEFDEDLRERARTRAACAWAWVQEFAPEDFRFTVVDPAAPPVEISPEERAAIRGLRRMVADRLDDLTEKEIQNGIYEIARENGIEPKEFFPVLYRVLVDAEKGPRLGGFFKTLGRDRLLAIFDRY